MTTNKSVMTQVIAYILPPVIMIAALLFTLLAGNQIDAYQKNRQALSSQTATVATAREFNTFVTQNDVDLQKIDYALPGESMIISVVKDLETTIKRYDPHATDQFTSSTPTLTGINLTIPITVTCQMPLTQLPLLLADIQKLPYIIQLVSIQSVTTNDTVQHSINMRLYVQQPFTGL